jgi:hypothetical protein
MTKPGTLHFPYQRQQFIRAHFAAHAGVGEVALVFVQFEDFSAIVFLLQGDTRSRGVAARRGGRSRTVD